VEWSLMAIHATERLTNVRARLGEWLDALTITGTPQIVHDGAPLSRVDDATGWVKVTLEPLPEFHAGLGDGVDLYGSAVLLILDVFWPSGEDGRAGYNAHDIEKATDDICYGMRRMSLTFLDYSSTPASPVDTTTARLRSSPGTLSRVRIPTTDSYDRRRVTSQVHWMAQHS
jgi:hypothetical protein